MNHQPAICEHTLEMRSIQNCTFHINLYSHELTSHLMCPRNVDVGYSNCDFGY